MIFNEQEQTLTLDVSEYEDEGVMDFARLYIKMAAKWLFDPDCADDDEERDEIIDDIAEMALLLKKIKSGDVVLAAEELKYLTDIIDMFLGDVICSYGDVDNTNWIAMLIHIWEHGQAIRRKNNA